MTSQILFDLVLTTASSFSLVGLLAIAAMTLPWEDEELKEVEDALAATFRRTARSSRSVVISMDATDRFPKDRAARRAA